MHCIGTWLSSFMVYVTDVLGIMLLIKALCRIKMFLVQNKRFPMTGTFNKTYMWKTFSVSNSQNIQWSYKKRSFNYICIRQMMRSSKCLIVKTNMKTSVFCHGFSLVFVISLHFGLLGSLPYLHICVICIYYVDWVTLSGDYSTR